MSNTLVKILGFPATLIHGNPNVLARWNWLRRRLPRTNDDVELLDVGCGSGAFTIGAALRGYQALGLSWDDSNNQKAAERARLCKARTANFSVQDVRNLHEREELRGKFDAIICLECAEHIIDDFKLLRDISACMKPGGRLLLTVPHYHYRAIDSHDDGPFSKEEDGWHVRRGYTPAMLQELCEEAGLVFEGHSYCSGFFSQKITKFERRFRRLIGVAGAWALLFPFRPLTLFDAAIYRVFRWPYYSIGMEAYKRRSVPGKSS